MMKKKSFTFWVAIFLVTLALAQPEHSGETIVSDFHNLTLAPESFWNGADGTGMFTSGLVRFYNDHNPDWGVWSGWAYSNVSDNETPGFMNQYGAITGGAFGKSEKYHPHIKGVTIPTPIAGSGDHAGYSANNAEGIYALAYNPGSLTFTEPEPHLVSGFYVTNSTYTALSMRDGDDFSKKFGGEDGNDPDWFRLSVWGMLNGIATDTIHFYLADYRFENKEENYIIDSWEWLELTSLGKVDSLLFSLSSSDVGAWGMNTPAYFCVDHIHVVPNPYQTKYIAEVFEYVPAPGQFINKMPLGHPESAASIIGKIDGALSLGAFGGYVVFRFDQPVVNHPDNPFGIDFILFGNPFDGFSEPGIVSVMKDENRNGLPDGTWYELAGSDHFFSTTRFNSKVTYHNPGGESARDVIWEDDQGQTGYVLTNPFHQQPYYPDQALFPFVDEDRYTLSGTRIAGHIDFSDSVFVKSHHRAFGYTDNRPRGEAPWHIPANPYSREVTNAGGDGFDIGWAVDTLGNYVDLDTIHFVRVHTGLLANAGLPGEISTEVTGATMVKPDPAKTGVLDMVVIRDIPPVITSREWQLEALAFHRGRVQWDEKIAWTTNLDGSYIDDNGVIHLSDNGVLVVTAYLADNPDVFDITSAKVQLDDNPTGVPMSKNMEVRVYPNPARDVINISEVVNARLSIFNMGGALVKSLEACNTGQSVDLRGLQPGVYLLLIEDNHGIYTLKLIKQ